MLTDNEIKKALECCGDEDIYLCSICPLYRENPHNDFCQEDLHKSALDLINRLEAENERLKNRFMDMERSCHNGRTNGVS